ncbi:MAG TPA: hypothetical protein VFB81_11060 [Myxococcales bacterium]|nr:hypothetical protein [Myxococcales bacterium]
MSVQLSRQTGSVARVLAQQPDRVAAAWRRLRHAGLPDGQLRNNLLDDVVEPFVKEIGAALEGTPGSPWGRTQAVLRISRARGAGALYDELTALKKCLFDACDALGGSDLERTLIGIAVEEAADSAHAHYRHLFENAEPPVLTFGGLVVEQYEHFPKIAVAADNTAVH